jgi:hypothetical protein
MTDVADELARFAPPDVPLRLTATGPGSRAEIIKYVTDVLEQRTTPNGDTSAERLARGITTSILSRLGAGYSISSGEATVALVKAEDT